jgi:hypothetical protein
VLKQSFAKMHFLLHFHFKKTFVKKKGSFVSIIINLLFSLNHFVSTKFGRSSFNHFTIPCLLLILFLKLLALKMKSTLAFSTKKNFLNKLIQNVVKSKILFSQTCNIKICFSLLLQQKKLKILPKNDSNFGKIKFLFSLNVFQLVLQKKKQRFVFLPL